MLIYGGFVISNQNQMIYYFSQFEVIKKKRRKKNIAEQDVHITLIGNVV